MVNKVHSIFVFIILIGLYSDYRSEYLKWLSSNNDRQPIDRITPMRTQTKVLNYKVFPPSSMFHKFHGFLFDLVYIYCFVFPFPIQMINEMLILWKLFVNVFQHGYPIIVAK